MSTPLPSDAQPTQPLPPLGLAQPQPPVAPAAPAPQPGPPAARRSSLLPLWLALGGFGLAVVSFFAGVVTTVVVGHVIGEHREHLIEMRLDRMPGGPGPWQQGLTPQQQQKLKQWKQLQQQNGQDQQPPNQQPPGGPGFTFPNG